MRYYYRKIGNDVIKQKEEHAGKLKFDENVQRSFYVYSRVVSTVYHRFCELGVQKSNFERFVDVSNRHLVFTHSKRS